MRQCRQEFVLAPIDVAQLRFGALQVRKLFADLILPASCPDRAS